MEINRILCFFKSHKWRYYNKIIYLRPTMYLKGMDSVRKVDTAFRICDRCYKKQREIIDYNRPYKEWIWVSSDLSKDEIREKRINYLLKKNGNR